MSLEVGGLGAKDGIEFERLCSVELCFKALRGQITSFAWERPAQEGRGADFVVAYPNGSIERRSCKIANGIVGTWPIVALSDRGVLKDAQRVLESDPSLIFTFVSRDASPELISLGDRARRYDSHSDFTDSIAGSGTQVREEFQALAEKWELDPQVEDEARSLHSLVSRFYCEQGPWGRDAQHRLQRESMLLAEGEPTSVMEALGAFAWERRGNHIHADQLSRRLAQRGFPAIVLSATSVSESVERLRLQFVANIRSGLIGSALLPRPEISRILTWARGDSEERLCVVHGEGGVGKSAIFMGLAEKLRCRQVPVLPISLDYQRPESSLQQFSRDLLGLPGRDPAASLTALAGKRRCLILIDQLDAIRWTGQHCGAATVVLRQLVDSARSFPNLRLILGCRSFDWRDSKELRSVVSWSGSGAAAVHEIEIGGLGDENIDETVRSLGADPSRLDERDRSLLSKGDLLAIWAELYSTGAIGLPIRSRTALFREYWDRVPEKISKSTGLDETLVCGYLESLVQYLDREGRLDAAFDLIPGSSVRGALVSVGALREESRRLTFVHQSHLDFHVAFRIYRQIGQTEKTAFEWLLSRGQDLFRRRQFQLLLQLLSDEEPDRYVATLREVLERSDVRYHVKQLVFSIIRGFGSPRPREVELIVDLLSESEKASSLVREALGGSTVWFDSLDHVDWFEKSLISNDESIVDLALEIIRRLVGARSIRVSELLTAWLESTDDTLVHPRPAPSFAARSDLAV